MKPISALLACAVAWVVLGSAECAAGTVGLREAAEEAAKPPESQKVLDREEPSQTKEKSTGSESAAAGSRSSRKYDDSFREWWIDLATDVLDAVFRASPAPPRPPGAAPPPPPPPATRLRLGLTAGGGRFTSADHGPDAMAGLLVGLQRGRLGLDLRFQRGRVALPPEVRAGLETPTSWSGDLALRFRLSPREARMHLHLVLSARWGRYDWRFANPIEVATPGGVREVRSDDLHFGTGLIGLGLVPVRSDPWSLQFTFAGGYRTFDGATSQGFANDVFEDGPVVEARAEIVFSP